MKTKLFERSYFINFDDKSFFCTLLGFTPYWDYKPNNGYISQKIITLSTIDKIHVNCAVIDGSVLNSIRQPTLCNFVSDKPPGHKVFCEPETADYKKKQNCFQ